MAKNVKNVKVKRCKMQAAEVTATGCLTLKCPKVNLSFWGRIMEFQVQF